MRSRRDVLCIGHEDWDAVWRRNQFLLAGLASMGAVRQILFVERPCDVTYGLRSRGLFRRHSEVRVKLGLALGGPRRGSDVSGLWLLTPFKLLPNGVAPLRRVNEWLERVQVQRAMRTLRMKKPVFWTQNPEAAHWLEQLDDALTVYDATDDWSLAIGSPGWVDDVRRGQERLAEGATVVLACSPALCGKWSRLNVNTRLVLNGVDVAHFSRVRRLPLPPDVARFPHPVLGYTGTLHDERVDVELVRRVALTRPDWQVVFVGPDHLTPVSREALRALPNVHLLGPRPYDALPAYMGLFDACIIPHRVTGFTESLNPIKIYEYLASGLPIVSTPVATVRDFPDVVYLARDHEAFIAAVERALAERDDAKRRERREIALGNSWARRVEQVQAALSEQLANRAVMSAPTTPATPATPMRARGA